MVTFENWRKRQMMRYKCTTLSHYHRVEDAVYNDVASFLRQVLITRVNAQCTSIYVALPDCLANSIIDFLNQMDFAYIHPRRNSARYAMAYLLNPRS